MALSCAIKKFSFYALNKKINIMFTFMLYNKINTIQNKNEFQLCNNNVNKTIVFKFIFQ